MKRLSYNRKRHQIRVARKRLRKLLKLRRRARTINAIRPNYHLIVAPHVFNLHETKYRNRLASFLRKLRHNVVTLQRPVQIDLLATKKMWAGATLLFKAELIRIYKITNGKAQICCRRPSNKKVQQVLRQTAIGKLLRFRVNEAAAYEDVIHWRHAEGTNAEGAKYDTILGKYDGTIAEPLAKGLYLGLTEAMTNCHHHAYIKPRSDGLDHQDETTDWWMFSQEKDGNLHVVFVDLGVGIPGSLPVKQPSLWKRLTFQGVEDDATVIEEAVKESRSRTGLPHRGKGLKQLVDIIEITPRASLHIYSNSGLYKYDQAGVEKINYSESILGTLIAWRVPLDTVPKIDELNEAD